VDVEGTKDLSVVIATWNARELLKDCLRSIYEHTSRVEFEIIVVDNASTDSTLDMLAAFPEVVVIENQINRGVAPARNQGLQVAMGRYILLLDADTTVTTGAFHILLNFMYANTKVGLAGPKLISPEGELQLTCRNLPTVFSKVLRRVPFSFAQDLLREELLANWDHNSVREVDYVIGACQIIRREAVDEVGLLDDNIIYGPEDIDYCVRMWRKGWKVCYVPQATVVHREQRATKNRLFSRLTWLHLKGLVYYFIKYRYLFDSGCLRGQPDQSSG